ncbi:MAG: phospholipase D-like domain-containing protein [Candidatus Woesearchaeota archaeon]
MKVVKNNIKLALLLLIIAVFLSSCNMNSYSTGFNLIAYENNLEPKAYYCPKDDCMQVFINNINSANETIHCAFYDLQLKKLINAFSNTTINTQIIIDSEYYKKNEELYNDINHLIKPYYSNSYMHHKFCVIDEKITITGSFNPTNRGNYYNNNNIVVVYSEYIAKNYINEFKNLWHNKKKRIKTPHPIVYLNNNKIENHFCPDECYSKIYTNLINNANKNIYFMTFSFTRDDIGDSLINAHTNNLTIKGVFEKSQNNKWLEYSKLKDAGLDVRWDKNPKNMHHKVFIIDNEITITGSTNPSNNGFTRNQENIIIFYNKNLTSKYFKEFEYIYHNLTEK